MKSNFALSLFTVAATLLFLQPFSLRANENSGPLSADERAAFLAELQPLRDQLAALRRAPNVSLDRWADAQIFVKGVVWALDFGPVSDAKGRDLVRNGLVRARERIEALSDGKAPWAERRGRSVRGFVSAVDNSVQPYGLVIPAGYDPATVLVCINAQVMYYPTKVGTMRGTLSTSEEREKWPASEKQRFENVKAFFDAGQDPYAIMLAEARQRGREALLTFRMNDDHGNDCLRTQFKVDHPDWRLGTRQYQGRDALDFGRDEVRDYTFRLIEEAVRRYDSDGIELDFNRFPNFFKDGSTDERVAKMNSLVKRVRKMLDEVGHERGRRLILSVRPPSNLGRTPPTPETARKLGCDVPAWVKHGWVDFVAVSEFLYERGDLPMDKWKQAITTVPVYGGIECTKGGGAKNLTADEYRQAATQLLKAGADGVYLFNFFTSREGGKAAYEPPFEVLRDLAVKKESDQKTSSRAHGWKPHEVRQLAGKVGGVRLPARFQIVTGS